jgi:hypothetical protein
VGLSARSSVVESYASFSTWLAKHPLAGDQVYGASSVRYQVARYCDYLHANPWAGGDPLRESEARDGAMKAYEIYLDTFGTPATTVRLILVSVDHFYLFLGLGTTGPPP